MAGRRSLPGQGRVSLIYTVGSEDLHADGIAARRSSIDPVLNATIGEDFADCRWPVTIKAQSTVTQPDLANYLSRLAATVQRGFFMQPGAAAALYWRWTGSVPPGMTLDRSSASHGLVDIEQALGTGTRSHTGTGRQCGIYLVDDAANWDRPDFYGRKFGGTAVSASVDEDFAATSWPVVVKAHPQVTHDKLCQYLTDVTMCVKSGFFVEVTPALL